MVLLKDPLYMFLIQRNVDPDKSGSESAITPDAAVLDEAAVLYETVVLNDTAVPLSHSVTLEIDSVHFTTMLQ